MKLRYGKGPTKYGTGVNITLTGEEVATAISAYLVARGVAISGSRTITVNEGLCRSGRVFVDPSGYIVRKGKMFSGRGPAHD